MYKVHPIPALDSNYIWIIEDPDSRQALVVDPGESAQVIEFLDTHGLELAALLITHSHWDHVTGIDALVDYAKHQHEDATQSEKNQTGSPLAVFGPREIPQVNRPLTEGDTFNFNSLTFNTMHTPGHLPEHLSYVTELDETPAIFCGDTLFSAGCGRIFSGTPAQFHRSLQRIASLPPETKVYCTHEYTEANLKFALTVEPDNAVTKEYLKEVQRVRSEGSPSLPTLVGIERKINPFLKTGESQIQQRAKQRDPTIDESKPEDVFGVIRAWKDVF